MHGEVFLLLLCISITVQDTYLSSLLRTILILLFRGLFFSGMENQVFLPMITTFCLPAGEQGENQIISGELSVTAGGVTGQSQFSYSLH